MANHVCQLVEMVAKHLCKPAAIDSVTSEVDCGHALLKKLSEEWEEFFSVSTSGNLLRLSSRLAG